MGRIYKPTKRKPDGSVWTSPRWYCEYVDADGRQRRMPASTNKKNSQALLQELEGQAQRIRHGLEEAKPRNNSPRISDLVRDFLDDQKRHLKPRTLVGYRESLQDLFEGGVADRDKPWLPKIKKVTDLTPEVVRDYQRRALKVLSPRSVNRKVRNLTALLSWAVRQGLTLNEP